MRDVLLQRVAAERQGIVRRAFYALAARNLAIALALAGAAGLVMRRAFAAETNALAALALLVVPAVLLAWHVARRRTPRDAALISALDRDAGGTGRLLTRDEIDDTRYDGAVRDVLAAAPRPAPPALRRDALRIAPWLAFAAIPFFLAPARLATGSDPRALTVDAALTRLDEKLATLEEEVALEKTGDSDLRERLDAVRDAVSDAAREGSLDSALEALDRMERDLAAAAERAETAIERAADATQAALENTDAAALDASFEELAAELEAAGLGETLAAAREELANAAESRDGAASPSNPLAAALANQLSEKRSALQSSGLLPAIDPELAAKLAALAEQLAADGELGELTAEELAALEELDLCDDESHGPG